MFPIAPGGGNGMPPGGEPAVFGGGKGNGMLGGPPAMLGGGKGGMPLGGIPGPPGIGGMPFGGKGGMFGGMLGAMQGQLGSSHVIHVHSRPPRPPCMNGGGIPGMPASRQRLSAQSSRTKLTWRRESTGHRHAHRASHAHAHRRRHGASREAAVQVRRVQRVRLAFQVVCIRDAVNDLLCLVARYLLVVGLDVAQVIATAVVRFAYAHTVVREVDIAVVAKELRHCGGCEFQG